MIDRSQSTRPKVLDAAPERGVLVVEIPPLSLVLPARPEHVDLGGRQYHPVETEDGYYTIDVPAGPPLERATIQYVGSVLREAVIRRPDVTHTSER
ncbi:MAG: hypothetical protein RIT81_17670 [Deltaproteobacteria bacterium]